MESAAQRLRKRLVPDPLAASDQSPTACARRLAVALQMSDEGVEIMRTRLEEGGVADPAARLREWLWEEAYDENWLRPNPSRFA